MSGMTILPCLGLPMAVSVVLMSAVSAGSASLPPVEGFWPSMYT